MRGYAYILDDSLSGEALSIAGRDFDNNLLHNYHEDILERWVMKVLGGAIIFYIALIWPLHAFTYVASYILAFLIIAVIAVGISAWLFFRFSFRIAVMNDGIIFQDIAFCPKKPFAFPIHECVGWDEIEIIDFRGQYPSLKTTSGKTWPTKLRNNPFVPYAKIAEDLYVDQHQGKLPQKVVIFQGQGPAQAPARRSRLGDLFFFLIVVAAIVVGYPAYKGRGSIPQAVAPMVGNILPDAVQLAISQHPEWPTGVKLELRTIAAASPLISPLSQLAEIFGYRQNASEYFSLITLFWIMELTSRDFQVKVFADDIAKEINRTATAPPK